MTRRLVGHFGARVRPGNAGLNPAAARLSTLTPRETEVLTVLAAGRSNAEIAAELVLSQETVKTYVSRILTKLDLRDRVHLVVFAYQSGLVRPSP